MLTPFDDFPIHASADPVATPATGDPNHYDRYWFNGHQRDGDFYFGAAMGHYPVRGIIDAAFSLVKDGVEHSIFASGAMPLDRSTTIGPLRIEVLEPMRTIRCVIDPNEHGITCDLTFRATTVAIEEPRQQRRSPEGIVLTDHTRLTQWGTWEGTIAVDGDETRIDPSEVPGTRDRSWGLRPVGEQLPVIRQPMQFQAFWLWAPLHFEDRYTHLAIHEHEDGRRWLETALVLDPLTNDANPWGTSGVRECHDIQYDIEWEPGRREMARARSPSTIPSKARRPSHSTRSSPSACEASATGTPTGPTAATTASSRSAASPSASTTSIPSTSRRSTYRTSSSPPWATAGASGSSNRSPSAPTTRPDSPASSTVTAHNRRPAHPQR